MFFILYSAYLYTSILAPVTTIEITAQFLSLLFSTSSLTKSVILVINFIVLYILVGVQATMELLFTNNNKESFIHYHARSSAGLRQQTSTENTVDVMQPLLATTQQLSNPIHDDNVTKPAETAHQNMLQENTCMSVQEEEENTQQYEFLKGDPVPSLNDDELMIADTPDLSPPTQSTSSIAESSLSRQSSAASSQRRRFKKQQPKHQSMIITDSMLDTSSSFTSSKKVNFFSSVRLKRRKSNNIIIKEEDAAFQQQVDKPVHKKSVSTKLQKGLKSTTKKFSKLFS